MRTITFYSTKGQRTQKIQTEANTWGELQVDLDAKSIQYDGMQAVVNETKTILKLKDAILPRGLTAGDKTTDDITIFLTPSKMKAGSIDSQSASYSELRAYIKKERVKSDEAENHFGDYTHETTDSLRGLVQDWVDSQEDDITDTTHQVQNTCEESCNQSDKLSEALHLFQKGINILASIPGVSDKAELESLKEQATQIEFELSNG